MQRTKPLKRTPFPVPLTASGEPVWSSLPSTGGIARTAPLARSRTGKSAATRTGSKPKLCSMCHEPAARGSWYCAACEIVRELVLERDGYCCVCCGKSIVGQHYSLGHRLRASQGGRPVPSNLITLLGLGGELHHGRIDLYRDPADAEKGYRLKSGQDPLQVRVTVFRHGETPFSAWLWDDGRYHFDGPQEVAA